MIKYIKWFLGFVVVATVALVAHYNLPSRDVVRIVGTDVKRMDVGRSSFFWASPDAGTNPNWTRDVRFINTVLKDGSPYVYRNEDTEWRWPPYLKFHSSNLTAKAQDLAKMEGEVWVAVTHYGWRIKYFTIFPNAVKIEQVSGPDVFLIPWFNIAFFLILAGIFYLIFRMLRAFKRRQVDPVVAEIDNFVEGVGENATQASNRIEKRTSEATSGFRRWLKRWFG